MTEDLFDERILIHRKKDYMAKEKMICWEMIYHPKECRFGKRRFIL